MGAGPAQIADMPNIEKPITFEEFRASQEDALLRQREVLRDEKVAQEILAEGGGMSGWRQWDSNVLALQS